MLRARLLTALVLLPVILLVVLYGENLGTAVMIAVAAATGVAEYLAMAGHGFTKPEKMAISLYGGLIALAFLCPLGAAPGALLALGVIFHMMYEGHTKEPSRETLERIGHAAAAWLIIAYFLGHAVLVRKHGPAALFFVMALSMIGDTAAYFVGTAFGRHKLSPRVSPKKSIEGSVGGLAFTVAAGAWLSTLLPLPHNTPLAGGLVALVLNFAAQSGDLGESLLKRAAGVKDSGTIFPGHGGMLDRVDAFLITLPLYAAILSFYGG